MMVTLLAMVAGMASCEKDKVVEVSNILVNAKALVAEPEGGVVRFGYGIKDKFEGVELEVSSKSDWITDIKVYPSLVDVTVARNDSGKSRSAVLDLRYGDDRITLKLTQAAWFEPLTLTIDEVEATDVIISVKAYDEATTWIGQIVGKEWYESYTEEEIFYEDLVYFRQMAYDADVSVEEYIAGLLSKGSHKGVRMRGLDSESEYVVYVYGMNEYGVPTTRIYAEGFTTTAPYEGNDVTYDIDVRCERSTAYISIEPSHEGVAYYNNITTREHFEQCGSDMNALVEDVVANALENYLYWDYTEAEFYEYNTSYMAAAYDFETTSEQEYVVFAFKWDENLQPLSEVSYKWFTANKVESSNNQLSMTISKVTQSSFFVETKTTNDDPYTIFAVPKAEIKKLVSDSQIFDYIIAEYGKPELDMNKCKGDVAGTFSGLEADTEYTVLLFGYEAGTRTTAIVRQNITTPAAGDVEACVYDVEVSDVADRTARVKITPSDYSIWYYWNVFEASATDEDIKAYIEQTINSYYYGDYSEFGWEELTQGEISSYLSQLRPSTTYQVVVVPMARHKHEYTGSIRRVGEFTTDDAVIADITITASFDAYYDGDELNAISGDEWNFEIYAGYAVIPMHVVVDGNNSGYLYTIFDYVDGLDDPARYDDDTLLDALYEVGTYWAPAYFRGAWDKPMMIAAVAFDEAGNPSRVYRDCFTCTREGAADAQEFIDTYMGGSGTSAMPLSTMLNESLVVASAPQINDVDREPSRVTFGLRR